MSKITEENIKEKFEDLVTDLNKLSKFCKDNKIAWAINSECGSISDYDDEYELQEITKTITL